jgi:hypothetical protein
MIAAGCNGGGGKKATTTSAPSSSQPSSTSTAPSTTGRSTTSTVAPLDPAKAAKATAAVLQPTDFPAGWQAKPEEERLDHETTWQDLTRCLGAPDSARGLGSAVSPTFNHGLATQVTSAVEYLPPGAVSGFAAAFSGPKLTACAQEAFTSDVKRNAPPDAQIGTVGVAPLAFEKLGQLTVASRVTAMLDLGGLKITIFQDLTYVFKGDAVARVTFLNPGGPFDPALQKALVEKVAGRA